MASVGRPTEYSEEILKRATKYFDDCTKDGTVQELPQIAKLALILDCSRKTLYNWAEKNPEFLHILEKISAVQEITLISKGLNGDFNSTITKLMLTKHGYTDKQEVDHTTLGKELPTPLLNINALLKDNSPSKDSEAN